MPKVGKNIFRTVQKAEKRLQPMPRKRERK